mmetsp:Transcript_45570/g.140833  ORF Transcript_45570/g.140833 Transcript_45570/m.140833 type:complete len:651 (-) Transcript_45570:123-2075(-)
MPALQATEAEPEWKKQAPVLKVRVPAPKKTGAPAPAVVPRVVPRKESPFVPQPGGEATKPAGENSEDGQETATPAVDPSLPDPERVQQLAKAVFDECKAAEEKIAHAEEVAKPLSAGSSEVTQEMAEEAATATEAAVEEAIAAVQRAAKVMGESAKEMGKTEAAIKMKSSAEFLCLHGKFKSCKSKMEELRAAVQQVRRRTTDEKKAKEQKDIFDAHDIDQDGHLNSREVDSFARSEYEFAPSSEQVEKIISSLGTEDKGVPFENMHRLRAMVAIDKSVVRAREREAKKAEVQEAAAGVDKELKEAEAASARAAECAKSLGSQLLSGLRAAVGKAEAEAAASKELLQKAEALSAKMAEPGEEAAAQDETVKNFQAELAAGFAEQVARIRAGLEGLSAPLEKARKRFKHALLAENEALRVQAACAVRGVMQAKSKSGEQVYEQAGGKGDGLSSDAFASFAKSLDGVDAEKVEALFAHLAGSAESLSKENFLRQLTRLGYAVLRESPLTDSKAVGGDKPMVCRNLLAGETVEALDLVESKADGERHIRCRATKDGKEGWVKIAAEEAEAFLEPCGSYYLCVKETILTGAISISESETIRRVAKGEILEALSFEAKDEACGVMRIECKAARDGKTGFVSVAGNTGVTFLERLR